MPKRFGESLEWEVSWLKKGYGTSPKREHRRIEERCPEKMETCSVDTRLYTKKIFSAVGCGRMWSVKRKKRRG